jgi:hypothetical protein
MPYKPGALPGGIYKSQESGMKIREKPAVFEAQKVTSDMLMLAVQALIVGNGKVEGGHLGDVVPSEGGTGPQSLARSISCNVFSGSEA